MQSMEANELSLVFSHLDADMALTFYRDEGGTKGFCEVQLVDGSQKKPSSDELIQILNDHGVYSSFIEVDQIQKIVELLRREASTALRRVALGKAPKPGSDGKLVWLARYLQLPPPAKRQVSLNCFFENIAVEREVARIYPPESGHSGRDIFGEELPAPISKPVELEIDTTLRKEQLDDYEVVIATTSGYLEFKENRRLVVRDCLVLNSDVDVNIGNIDFVGRVHIVGSVREGCYVSAAKDLKIERGVQDGQVHSGADLSIGASMVGSRNVGFVSKVGQTYAQSSGRQHELVCGGNCKADLLQGVVAEIAGSLEVNREIRDCIIHVGGLLQMPQGQLLESAVYTTWGAEIGTLGTEGGTPAIVNLLSDLATSDELRKVDAQLAQLKEADHLIRIHLGPLADKPELLSSLGTQHRQKVSDLLSKLEQVQVSMLHYQQQREELRSQKLQAVQVNVLSAMYPGALIQCHGQGFSTATVLSGPFTVRFDINEGFIKESLRKLPKPQKEDR